MDKKILLFVDDKQSFITKSIIKNLEKDGNSCALIKVKVNDIET